MPSTRRTRWGRYAALFFAIPFEDYAAAGEKRTRAELEARAVRRAREMSLARLEAELVDPPLALFWLEGFVRNARKGGGGLWGGSSPKPRFDRYQRLV